jgi:hypothetical protein
VNFRRQGFLCLTSIYLCGAVTSLAQDVEPPVCSSMIPDARWHLCVGQVERGDRGRYYGEFSNGQPHGVGREVSAIGGTVYVGSFVYGKRIGTGIEYSLSRQVIRQGIWSGDFQKFVEVDANLFPYDGPFAKNFFRNFYRGSAVRSDTATLSNSVTNPVVLQERIEFLEKKIKELELANQSLRSELEKHPRPTEAIGEDSVRICLSRGLRPGTSAFSTCIADR